MQLEPSTTTAPGVLVGPQRVWPAPFGLPGLVRISAQRSPGAIALIDEEGTLSYAELEAESDALAARLRRSGGRRGDLVAVCMRRGRAMVVALLAAAKAGMPYLPLSTDDPQARRDLLLDLAQARYALVDAGTAQLVRERPGLEALQVELGSARFESWSALEPCAEDDAVYVLFTSGTTGTPKGVVVPSDALVNRLCWMHEAFGFRAEDRFLQKTPYTFDVSGWELWSPLIAGAAMVLPPPGAHLDPARMARYITDHRVTLCHFVPSMLAEFLRRPEAAECGSLRAVFCSGEELMPRHVREFRAVLGAVELHNLYGPTEAAIDVTHWPCPADGDVERTLIGSPISNCTLVVLDEDRTPTPPGAVGELAIGGVPLATGYLGQPELTARSFIEAPPWSPVPRLYLTGDLVRQRPEGIEFLGRKDAQVKIRGQRVELTAVEDALCALDDVTAAAAVALDRGAGQELCALVVLAPGADGVNGVRAELRRMLPDSHVPTLIFPVAQIALGSSGKLDRRKAAERAAELAESLGASEAPGGDDLAARLWFEATGAYPADASLGFLDAGGHSLTAVRLVGLVLARCGVRLPLRELLRANMSLADLRAFLATTVPAEADAQVDAVPADAALSPQQHGLWVWSRLFPDCPAYNVTAVLELDRHVDVSRLERAVNALIRYHPALRTTFHDSPEGVRRRVHPTDEAAVRVAVGSDEGVRTDVLDHHFAADRLPRLAVGVQRSPAAQGDTVLLAIDHLVSDQRTLDLVLAELSERYAGRRPVGGQAQHVAVEPTSRERRERDLAYWRDRLHDAPRTLSLPWQREHPQVANYRGASIDLDLGAQGTDAVEQFGAAVRVSPFALTLTAFARRLGLWSGTDDVVVGVPMTGRESPAEQDAVGFYVRTLPVRLQGAVERGAELAVTAVAEAVYEAAEHAAVSFEEIVEHVGGARDLTHNPLFRVWCNDISREAAPERFGEAAARLLHPPARWSLFDLGLYLLRGESGTLSLRLVYGTHLWSEQIAAQFLRQCRDDLLRAAGQEDARTQAEPEAVAAANVGGTCGDLVARVRTHARLTPDRVAISAPQRQITYKELWQRTLRISAAVRERVSGTAPVVGVLARRRSELAETVLGCWHAGAAPLLIDADAPQQWRTAALGAADAAFVIDVGDAPDPIEASAPDTPAFEWSADRVGHVLLTSGTTGKPAVVPLPADALPAVLDGYAQALGLTADDVFAFTTPPDHDPVFRDLLLPLLLGATVHVGAAGDYAQRRIPRWLDEIGATVLHVTPSQGALLAAAHVDGTLPSLRRVVFHGDQLRYGAVAALRRLAPSAELYNLYGTTETPQASGLRRIAAEERGAAQAGVPIAASAPHRTITVLGPDAVAAPGVLGEITVTGAGVTGRYRTGDLGRLRADGLIDVVGRADRQASVGGHRVQIDNVEAALRAVPGVANCHAEVEHGTSRLVAWWTGPAVLSSAEILADLRRRLPEAEVPARLRRVDAILLTARGKVDVEALRQAGTRPDPGQSSAVADTSVLDLLLRHAAELQPGLRLEPDDDFFEAGLTSLGLLRLYDAVTADAGRNGAAVALTIADFFRFPTARRLAQHAVSVRPERRRDRAQGAASMGIEPIAVVGLAARVPDAGSVDEFWANLLAGRNSIHRLTEWQLLDAGESAKTIAAPNYIRARPLLDDVWGFDHEYFGISRRESTLRNPQHRLFLELCDTALQSAGTVPDRFGGTIGVYGGSATDRFLEDHFRADPQLMDQVGETVALISNNVDFLPSYASYRLGLRGPAVAVRTACSTSLVAVHLACQALRTGDCDLALAGGVEIETPYGRGYLHVEGGIDSRDGVCRPLDAEASGTVFGSGGGVVALKRLSDARRDGDVVLAVLLGSAVNNDGPDRAGFTTPSSDGQSRVIAEAIAASGIDSASISYVELHGTGTQIGDPVEIRGLHRGMELTARGELRPGSCLVGSVKSNIGHLGPGSGVVGLIKTVLALHHETIPPTANLRTVNPRLGLERTPFAVADRVRPWPRVDGTPRRAGVSSFGFGGTNAHVVVEEAPGAEPRRSGDSSGPQLLVWSGTDDQTRELVGEALLRTAADATAADLAAVAGTSQTGRRALRSRAALRVDGPEAAREALDALTSGQQPDRILRGDGQAPQPVLLFPGQGAQRPAMGLDAGRWLPGHTARVREYLADFADLLGRDLIRVWENERSAEVLSDTVHSQPLLFAVELASAQSLLSLGVRPATVIGHSVGEVVAATVAGVFRTEDAIRFVAERARLMRQMPAGRMVAVAAPEGEVRQAMTGGVWVSAVNGPTQTVVGGSEQAVAEFCAVLDGRGIEYRRLSTSHAFHTPMMSEALPQFLRLVEAIPLSEPSLPLVSAASGRLLTDKDALRPEFWVNQLVDPVLFNDALEHLPVERLVLVECGPGPALSGPARRHPSVGLAGHPVVELLSARPGRHVLDALGELWASGVDIDFAQLPGERGRKYPLPIYPYRRTEFLLPDLSRTAARVAKAAYPSPATRAETHAQTVALPAWQNTGILNATPSAAPAANGYAVVLLPEDPAAAAAARRVVQRAGFRVVPIAYGDRYEVRDFGGVIRAGHLDDLDGALSALADGDRVKLLVHAAGSAPLAGEAKTTADGVLSLLRVLTYAAHQRESRSRVLPVCVLTRGAVAVTAAEPLDPVRAAAVGAVRAVAAQGPWPVRLLDVARTADDALAAEIAAPSFAADPVLALRGSHVWLPAPVEVAVPEAAPTLLRSDGRYAITDGLGPIGLALAQGLADTGLQPRLLLLTGGAAQLDDARLGRVRALEAAGAEVHVVEAGRADDASCAALFDRLSIEHGPVDGVFHTARADSTLRTEMDWAASLRDVALASGSIRFLTLLSPAAAAGSLGGAELAAVAEFFHAIAAATVPDGRTTVVSIEVPAPDVEDEHIATVLRMLREQSEPHLIVLRAQHTAHPQPIAEGRTQPTARDRPSGDLAAEIAGLWAQTLGLEVPVEADFFALGADSLTALQIAGRLRERLGVEVSVAEIFEAPTARELAAALGAKAANH